MGALISGMLTKENVTEVDDRQAFWKGPDLAKGRTRQPTEDCQADCAASNRKCGYLIELHARPVQHLQGKQGACSTF